ncbi:MAG: nicotinate (nicotinamide) nucleotide adenylyltransferase [Oscillospiraceae bacterium]|nr:nicotinate (nicotinamide) nucleotide adenylyltransferase [Oscillospiraceae bacterium]MBR4928256.1 nicotinate (nicotinamide) nucleotide adenylyltransferase [Oscillospiraceae bacterium]MBR5045837.1 nicotinate (nicotinamide) nucleotide adenylyltransferase [Oscillospiraceae bacterium]
MASEKLLFYGGSFDPPHMGHRRLLEAAIAAVGPDITLVIPTGLSPFKDRCSTPFRDRVRMARLAFADLETVRVSTLEGRGWRSYTYKTVRKLLKKYPGRELYMLIGSDMLVSFGHWHLYRRIMSKVILVAGCRDDDEVRDFERAAERLRKEGARIILLGFSPVEVSSTEIRDAVRTDRDLDGYISREVMSHIRKRGLYRE